MRAALVAFGLSISAGSAGAASFDVPGSGGVVVPGTELTAVLVAVTDFRCPSHLDCYWEGEKRVTLSILAADGSKAAIELCNACEGATPTASVFGVTFTFEDLLPPVEVIEALGREQLLTDYIARVNVGE